MGAQEGGGGVMWEESTHRENAETFCHRPAAHFSSYTLFHPGPSAAVATQLSVPNVHFFYDKREN